MRRTALTSNWAILVALSIFAPGLSQAQELSRGELIGRVHELEKMIATRPHQIAEFLPKLDLLAEEVRQGGSSGTAQALDDLAEALTEAAAPVLIQPSTLEKIEAEIKALKKRTASGGTTADAEALLALKEQLQNARKDRANLTHISPVNYPDDLNHQHDQVTRRVKEVLTLFPQSRFMIIGHTCNQGTESFRLETSFNRAQVLRNHLISKGVPANRLTVRGAAGSDPLVPNTTETNYCFSGCAGVY